MKARDSSIKLLKNDIGEEDILIKVSLDAKKRMTKE